MVASTKELPTALEIVAAKHHATYEFPQNGGARCAFFDGKRRCRSRCSRVAVARTCYKHTKAEKIVIAWSGKRSAEWVELAVACAKRPRTFCDSYTTNSFEQRPHLQVARTLRRGTVEVQRQGGAVNI